MGNPVQALVLCGILEALGERELAKVAGMLEIIKALRGQTLAERGSSRPTVGTKFSQPGGIVHDTQLLIRTQGAHSEMDIPALCFSQRITTSRKNYLFAPQETQFTKFPLLFEPV